MLSVANVRTAGGAARYFAADNYYTRADADRSGEWLGKGADKLGLSGEVDAKTFEEILKGFLPDGTRLGTDKREHRAGTDLTFSMPKSWSLLALVGGDRRILEAYTEAVKETLAWPIWGSWGHSSRTVPTFSSPRLLRTRPPIGPLSTRPWAARFPSAR